MKGWGFAAQGWKLTVRGREVRVWDLRVEEYRFMF
jgi:hypothetical protein